MSARFRLICITLIAVAVPGFHQSNDHGASAEPPAEDVGSEDPLLQPPSQLGAQNAPNAAAKEPAESQARPSLMSGSILVEAEAMQPENEAWQPRSHRTYADYYRFPSQLKYLEGLAGTAGSASVTTIVDEPGTYRIWIRNQDVPQGVFTFKVSQHGKTVAKARFDEQTTRAAEIEDVEAGWASGVLLFTWWHVDVTLEAGPCTLEVTKEQDITVNALDCFILTRDLQGSPKINDFNKPLYLRVVLGSSAKETGYATYFYGRVDRPPFLAPSGFITNRGYTYPEGFNNITPDMLLHAGDASPWVNIAPFLDQRGFNRMRFDMMSTWQQFPAEIDFVIELSTSSDRPAFKRIERSGKGSGIVLLLDVLNPDNSYSSIEGSESDLKRAQAIPMPIAGRLPTKFPLFTGLYEFNTRDPDIVLRNDLRTIRELGITGTTATYDGQWMNELGIPYSVFDSGVYHLTEAPYCFSRPLVDQIKTSVEASVRDYYNLGQDVLFTRLMDEYFSVDIDQGVWHSMLGCPACEARFRDYLKERGLKPTDLVPDLEVDPGQDPWEAIKPTSDKSKEKLYYYSMRCRGQIGADFFKTATEVIEQVKPGLRTAANNTLELTYWRNMMARGNDLYAIYKSNGLTYGLAGDANSSPPSAQTCSFIMDVLRSTCKYNHQPYGIYNICFTGYGFDIAAKTYAEIGHGARFIHYYDYGPYHSVASDPQSQRQDVIEAVKEANYVVGAAENDLMSASPAPTKVALVYSHSTDVWTDIYDVPYISNSGTERVDLYLLVRHLGYPIDIITEDDIQDGYCQNYDVIFLTESHLDQRVMPKLLEWVRNGGLLYATAGAARFDQFNQPADGLDRIGLKREDFIFKAASGYWPHTLEVEAKVTVAQGKTIDAAGGYQKVAADTGGQAVLQFDDGSQCVVEVPHGKGFVTYIGFFPGTSYVRGASIPELKRQAAIEPTEHISLSSNFYEPEYRELMKKLMKRVRYIPPLRVSHPLVEGCLLTSDGNYVVTLANWTGEKQTIQVSVDLQYPSDTPAAATFAIEKVERAGNGITFTMDVGSGDIIVLPRKNAP